MEKSDIKRNTNTWKKWSIRSAQKTNKINKGKYENKKYNKILIAKFLYKTLHKIAKTCSSLEVMMTTYAK